MRVVLDTNILVAAFATRGLCQDVFELCLAEHSILTSEFIIDELGSCLRGKLKVPIRNVRDIVVFLRTQCEEIAPKALPRNICRDRSDENILALAISGGADCIVTGDNDLLALKRVEGIPIFNPRQFWEKLSK
jgi:uncharacterized protein